MSKRPPRLQHHGATAIAEPVGRHVVTMTVDREIDVLIQQIRIDDRHASRVIAYEFDLVDGAQLD
ncbi:MAG: hypothetical protein QM811_14825 [Pirellulales bacterium]